MERFALLTVYGRDCPGIVAGVTRVLFEIGCNIEDSSMTRLRGQFTILLILRLPQGCDCHALEHKLESTVKELRLFCHLSPLEPADLAPSGAESDPEGCVIHVLGADHPGIVYRVTALLQQHGGNITDLRTQVLTPNSHPIYAMLIEAAAVRELEPLRQALATLARELGVEITVRAQDELVL